MGEENKNLVEQQPKVNPLVKRDGTAVNLIPQDLESAYKLAQRLSNSGLVPSVMRGQPDNVFAAMMLSIEIGVPIMQGISNIAVVNGRASIWGELATAVIRASGLCEHLGVPKFTGSGATLKVSVSGQRKGDKEVSTFEYSMEDAKLAGHLSKDTYQKNPKDMLMWKAMHRLYKFLWPDVLKGVGIREIASDEPAEFEGKVIIDAQPEPATPAAEQPKELSKEEIEKRAAEAKARFAQQEPAPAAKPAAKAAPEQQEEPAEQEQEPEMGEDKDQPTKKHVGKLVRCPYKANADKTGYEYFAILETPQGEMRFRLMSKGMAVAISELKGKEIEVFATDKCEVVKYGAK